MLADRVALMPDEKPIQPPESVLATALNRFGKDDATHYSVAFGQFAVRELASAGWRIVRADTQDTDPETDE